MKEFTHYTAVILLGLSFMTFVVGYHQREEEKVRIESLKVLYELKTDLENKKLSVELDKYIEETKKKIDSLENEE